MVTIKFKEAKLKYILSKAEGATEQKHTHAYTVLDCEITASCSIYMAVVHSHNFSMALPFKGSSMGIRISSTQLGVTCTWPPDLFKTFVLSFDPNSSLLC